MLKRILTNRYRPINMLDTLLDSLCEHYGCWRFRYDPFRFCIKHKCQNYCCNNYKMTYFEFCGFHKCGYSYHCANQREFLHYRMIDNRKRVPVYSKFCAEHNRSPANEVGEVWSFSDSEFETLSPMACSASESREEHSISSNKSDSEISAPGTPLDMVRRIPLTSLSSSTESSDLDTHSDSEESLSQ